VAGRRLSRASSPEASSSRRPNFPDSYSVNSANDGPYGDAMVEEVIPSSSGGSASLPQPYARHVEARSTGGWQSLALQLQHPDFFGGAWVLQPDPIDFHRYQLVDLYQDANAFEVANGHLHHRASGRSAARPRAAGLERAPAQLFEAALGSHGRSGFQLEGWEAVFGPVGATGTPAGLGPSSPARSTATVVESMRAARLRPARLHGAQLADARAAARREAALLRRDMERLLLEPRGPTASRSS
jgi:hypothetical protein